MSRAARRRLVGLALALVLALPLAADAQLVSPDRDPQRETPADEARIRLTRELLRLQRLTEQDPAAARARLVQLRAEHPDHRAAQRKGRADFYSEYTLQICEVKRVSHKSAP